MNVMDGTKKVVIGPAEKCSTKNWKIYTFAKMSTPHGFSVYSAAPMNYTFRKALLNSPIGSTPAKELLL
jgi:hypothetical protein